MKFELFTALRYLKSKKDNLFISKLLAISILTVALAITVPIVVLSIINGFHEGIREKIVGSNFQYRIRHSYDNFENYKTILKQLKSNPDIELAVPFFERQGLIRLRDGNEIYSVSVKGFYNKDLKSNKLFNKQYRILLDDELSYFAHEEDFEEDEEDQKTSKQKSIDKKNEIKEGIETIKEKHKKKKLPNKETNKEKKEPIPFEIKTVNGIIIGHALSRYLDAYKGGKIELMIPHGEIQFDLDPDNVKTMKVSQIYSADYAKFNKNLIFIHFRAAKELFHFNGLPTDIGVNLKEGISSKYIEALVKEYPNLTLENTLNESVFKDFAQEKSLMIVLLLFLVVSAFITVYIAVHVAVMDKRKEIGILKTIGAKAKEIQLIFIFEGLLISFTGVIFGTTLGILITTSITHILTFLENIINHFNLFIYTYAGAIFAMKKPDPFYFIDPNVFYLKEFPYSLNYSDIILLCVGAIFVSIFAAYFPSKNASEQKVVDSLKF